MIGYLSPLRTWGAQVVAVFALTFGNGVAAAWTHDLAYRLTGIAAAGGAGPVQQVAYSWDPVGNLPAANDALAPGRSQSFGYDNLNRLTSAQGPYGNYAWTYDAVGNRTAETLAQTGGTLLSKSFTYAATSNQLQSVSGSENRGFAYGPGGQLIADSRGAGDDLSLAYDHSGRLSQVSTVSGPVQRALYDPWGRRVMRVAGEETRFYHYDDEDRLIAVSDGAGAALVEWVWLPDPRGGPALPVAQIEGGQVYAVHADHLGQPVRLTNASGAVVWDRQTHPFGGTLAEMGPASSALRFPGQLTDPATATHYNMARDYDPSLGRYLQSDPIGLAGGWNTYAYVEGNPTSAVDPEGEMAWFVVPAARTIGAAAITAAVGIALDRAVDRSRGPMCSAIRAPSAFGPPRLPKAASDRADPSQPDDCEEEWEVAYQICRSELAKPYPNRRMTGGYRNLQKCAEGLVSERCGGNPVSKFPRSLGLRRRGS